MFLAKISKILKLIEVSVLILSVLVMALVTIVNVIGRSLFGYSLSSAEELAQFLIIAITFIGLAYGAREGRHIRMSAFYDQLPENYRKILMLTITFLTSALLYALCFWATQYVLVVKTLETRSAALGIPLYLVYSLAPMGLFMAGTQYLLGFIQNFRKEEIYLSFSEQEHKQEGLD